jgi:hypothetical protein
MEGYLHINHHGKRQIREEKLSPRKKLLKAEMFTG